MRSQIFQAAAVLAFAAFATAAPCDSESETGVALAAAAAATSEAVSTTTKANKKSKSTKTSSEDSASETAETTTKTSSKSKTTSTEAAASETAETTTKKSSKTTSASAVETAAVTSAATTATAAAAVAAGSDLPASSGTSTLAAVQTIAAGESFDGGMYMIDRGVSCTGQAEGGDSDAVFELEDGATLSNVIIGPNQIEGVHCFGACTLTNVWWSAVCEDAFTVKEQDAGETTTITGGGAFGADDKVLQHNGGGTISVSGFTVSDFGKLYRSCGNCDTMYERHIIFDSISATTGSELAGINSNYGDTATFTNVVATDVDDICVEYEGNDTGDEPSEISSGISSYCVYTASDVTSS